MGSELHLAVVALLLAAQAAAMTTCPAGCSPHSTTGACTDLCICNDPPTFVPDVIKGKATIYNLSPTSTANGEQGCCTRQPAAVGTAAGPVRQQGEVQHQPRLPLTHALQLAKRLCK